MSKIDNVVSYMAKITELRNHLSAIGTKVEDKELVSIALNGLLPSWRPFVQGVYARETLPALTKLWDDLMQEEIRLQSCSAQQEEVEEIALVGRTKIVRKATRRRKAQGPKKKDFSKVMCFRCHEMGHYASQCPKKKGKARQVAAGTVASVDEDSYPFEIAFSMVSCFSSNTMSSVRWYVDSGASRDMTYDITLFKRLQEQEGGMSVELGDYATYLVRGVGSISFQMRMKMS